MIVLAMFKHYRDLRKHKKIVKEICREKIEELYRSPLYIDGLHIKEELKDDINVYKSIDIFHDLSSYSPNEFIPIAIWKYGKNGEKEYMKYINESYDKIPMKVKTNFTNYKNALQHHYQNNYHHWNYNRDMTRAEIIEMTVDWEATCRENRLGSASSYYIKNYNEIELSPEARIILEDVLNLRFFKMNGFKYDVLDKSLLELKLELGRDKFNKLLGERLLGDKMCGEVNISLYDLLP